MKQKRTFCPNAAKNKLDLRILSKKNQNFNLRPHGLKKKKTEKKTLQLLKSKGAASEGHLLLPLLFLENKRCMHKEVGTC